MFNSNLDTVYDAKLCSIKCAIANSRLTIQVEESLFRTAKYRPEFPANGFAELDAARAWAVSFVHWYNIDHRHSGIRYVSPAQRHAGEDLAILAARHAGYASARDLNPARWTGQTRYWMPVAAMTLNPERDCVIKALSRDKFIQPLAA